jgi:hypothetical protein
MGALFSPPTIPFLSVKSGFCFIWVALGMGKEKREIEKN